MCGCPCVIVPRFIIHEVVIYSGVVVSTLVLLAMTHFHSLISRLCVFIDESALPTLRVKTASATIVYKSVCRRILPHGTPYLSRFYFAVLML